MNDQQPLPPLVPAGLLTEATRIRKQIAIENSRRVTQDRRRNFAIVAAIVAAMLGVTIGFSGRTDAHSARAALNGYISATSQARVASCEQDNAQRVRARKAFEDTASVLVSQTRNPTSQQKILIAAYLHANHLRALADFPLRGCTLPEIAKFLNQKGTG